MYSVIALLLNKRSKQRCVYGTHRCRCWEFWCQKAYCAWKSSAVCLPPLRRSSLNWWKSHAGPNCLFSRRKQEWLRFISSVGSRRRLILFWPIWAFNTSPLIMKPVYTSSVAQFRRSWFSYPAALQIDKGRRSRLKDMYLRSCRFIIINFCFD